MSDVSVIILNYCTWQDTLREIKMINTVCGIDYEDIVVIDNASPNNSIEMLRKNNHFGFTLIESSQNNGYATGNNIGLKYACEHGYKYAWILNNDVIISNPNTLSEMKKVFKYDSKVAVVNPDIIRPDGKLYNRDAVRPNFFDLTIGIFTYRKKGREIVDLGGYCLVYRTQGCCMLVDIEKIKQIDYLDENTFLYCEEMILAERLLKKDYKCATCLTIKAIHNHSNTVSSTLRKKKVCKIINDSFEYYLITYRNYNSVCVGICLLFNYIKWWFLA